MTIGLKGRNEKRFYEYVLIDEDTNTSIQQYIECPASTFLRYCSAAKNAITTCQRSFSKTKVSLTHLRHISVAMLPAIMGHFETYQRFLFSGVFDLSGLIKEFNPDKFFGEDKDKGLGIKSKDVFPTNFNSILGYRGIDDLSIGILLADNLSGWHDPEKVNRFFKAFDLKTELFSKRDCMNLEVLWQLRHSIVHTGGTITLPDAQKVKLLSSFGGHAITFQDPFIVALTIKFSEMVKISTKRIEKAFKDSLDKAKVSRTHQKRIEKLFLVE